MNDNQEDLPLILSVEPSEAADDGIEQAKDALNQNDSAQVLIGTRESSEIARALSALAARDGMSRSKLVSRMIHQALNHSESKEAPPVNLVTVEGIIHGLKDSFGRIEELIKAANSIEHAEHHDALAVLQRYESELRALITASRQVNLQDAIQRVRRELNEYRKDGIEQRRELVAILDRELCRFGAAAEAIPTFTLIKTFFVTLLASYVAFADIPGQLWSVVRTLLSYVE